MSKTRISWTEETWNPTIGCSRVSEGCRHCYAEVQAASIAKGEAAKGRTSPYLKVLVSDDQGPLPRWNGRVDLLKDRLETPLRWTRPRMVFVNSMSDLFHENLPFEEIAAVFGVMAATPRHVYQVLTKRPERALAFFKWLEGRPDSGSLRDSRVWWCAHHAREAGAEVFMRGAQDRTPHTLRNVPVDTPWPLPNVWLGVSCENQETAEERIPLLLQCPAVVRWVSAEPLLGYIDFILPANLPAVSEQSTADYFDALTGLGHDPQQGVDEGPRYPHLDWVVVGGESGSKARDCLVAAISDLVVQCTSAEVPVFVKQLGSKALVSNRWDVPASVFRDLEADGWDEETPIYYPPTSSAAHSRLEDLPEHLKVRQWPQYYQEQQREQQQA